jgi:hypothetical protein
MNDPAPVRNRENIFVGQGAFRYRVEGNRAMYLGDGPHGEAVAVARDGRDRVFIFLRGPHPVQVHEPDGTFVTAWGEELFVRPHGIFIGPDDTVYCTDDCRHGVAWGGRSGADRRGNRYLSLLSRSAWKGRGASSGLSRMAGSWT